MSAGPIPLILLGLHIILKFYYSIIYRGEFVLKKIFAIGGLDTKENFELMVEKLIKFVGLERPNVLFIPAPRFDNEEYWGLVQSIFKEKYKCNFDKLILLNEIPEEIEVKEQILRSDLVFVGGGNTLKMLELWEKSKVDKYLKQAYDKGITLSGTSAGAICWFKHGHSDSLRYTGDPNWKYIKIDGLNYINALVCPHYNAGNRKEDFAEMMIDSLDVGIGIDNNCAIQFVDDTYSIVATVDESNAYKIISTNNKMIETKISNDGKYRKIYELLNSPNILPEI